MQFVLLYISLQIDNILLYTCCREIDDRYLSICDVAKTRSVISLGLSCFKLQHGSDCGDKSQETRTFLVQTFNVFVLCNENYVVEPLALQFLVSHGFDFNRQYAHGLPYSRGNDPVPVCTIFILQSFQCCYEYCPYDFYCDILEVSLSRCAWHICGSVHSSRLLVNPSKFSRLKVHSQCIGCNTSGHAAPYNSISAVTTKW